MEKRMAEIKARKLEIRAMLEGNEEVDIERLEEELRALDAEANKLEKRAKIMRSLQGEGGRGSEEEPPAIRKVAEITDGPSKEDRAAEETKNALEKRGKDLKEGRSVLVGGGTIVVPTYSATDIRPTFNEVSSLVDRVTSRNLPGGESFTQPYITGYGEGDYKTEGQEYADAEPTFGSVTIAKAKITAYAEESEEVIKLPAANYSSEVVKGITVAIRKKITKQILVGTGAANTLAGIFTAAATAISAATDIELAEIDETSLDEIMYSFGGDEDVEDTAVLILDKMDLKAFACLRDADGRKIYTIVNRGNTGTIDGVPFIINSVCNAVSNLSTSTGAYCMAYGPLSNYLLTIFSDLEVMRSTDYKFKTGMVAHKGVIYVGGNVISKNGFLRVKKA